MNIILVLLFWGAELPDGNALLARIDENTVAGSRMVVAEMRITTRRGVRIIRFRSYSRGDSAFVEYLAPERERGTKMLKLGRDLWIYTPESDRTIRISGHMLRQSVSGSDLSYEDMMEEAKLSQIYTAVTTGSDSLNSRPVWVVELKARASDVAYPARKIWVDRERFTVLREERFSKSGKPLKGSEVLETKQIDDRWVVTRAVFRDLLKSGGGTEFIIEEIQLDSPIPPTLFSKASLRRGLR